MPKMEKNHVQLIVGKKSLSPNGVKQAIYYMYTTNVINEKNMKMLERE
jgi:hypothetical protein